MRIFTKPADPSVTKPSQGPSLQTETYTCAFGTGRILVVGALPVEVELPQPHAHVVASPGEPSEWGRLLERYFAGEAITFDLDMDAYAEAAGLSDFARDVFAALAAVPYGEVVSYRELAAAAGRPHAFRAAGSVMARNRLPVILPCHRVVHNDGSLGRYGDDPAWKERLLALEGVGVEGGRLR